ncbi:MAG TPA: glycosyltransferase family 4 protein [Stellaceae bacterium]|nr:glycosyltransferase family 4 protein [Stellaceae bacterium]
MRRRGSLRPGVEDTLNRITIFMTIEAETSTPAAAAGTRPPAVLQVLPRLVTGGVERGTVEVAAALVAAGWRAVVASEGGPMVREIERAGALHVELPLASKNPITMRRNVERLAQLIRREPIDIIHARSRAPAWSALGAARRTGSHLVTTFHNAYGDETWLKRRYNAVMAEGERVIAISRFVGEHAMRVYGVPAEKLRIIERGVEFGRFDPERVSAERVIRLAREWQLPDGVQVVMLPGRLTRWKGQLVLVDAVARLNRRDLRCLLVGTGDGRYRQQLLDTIARRGLGGLFQVIEDCRDIAAAYKLADVVVSASTRPEGFGRVIAEGQAMGRPVIATNHGGAREIVLDGETGWLVPPDDAEALAGALSAALALSPAGRLALAQRGIAHMRAHFTTQRMTSRTLAVYEEILFPEAAQGDAAA